MDSRKTLAQRLGHLLERVTRQSGRLLPETSAYGSWLLGRETEPPEQRRVRIQVILTGFLLVNNLLAIGVTALLVVVAYPNPDVFTAAPRWLTLGLVPAYAVTALVIGSVVITRHGLKVLNWAVEQQPPTAEDLRATMLAPWYVAVVHLIGWALGAVILATAYGYYDSYFIPRFLGVILVVGVMTASFSYLVTEFTLRPVAAQALVAGEPPRRLAPGVMGRIMTVWMLGAGIPIMGIALSAVFALILRNLTLTQFTVAVLLSCLAALVFGFTLMWVAVWITTTPIRVVRAALKRVEEGDLDTTLVVFDGTELGQLQRGFNSMVHGLREREKVRDLFSRHVGREVAEAAEAATTGEMTLGGEERDVAVLFIDIIGSTMLVSGLAAWEVVALLNRFFAVIVDEVEMRHGLLNKFQGDGCLVVFGAPNDLEHPEDAALETARAVSIRLALEVPEVEAAIAVTAGDVVAGNVGARERFEYNIIGEPVNEAARLCELAKTAPGRLIASADAVRGASEAEQAHWSLGNRVKLRGLEDPTQLATLVQ